MQTDKRRCYRLILATKSLQRVPTGTGRLQPSAHYTTFSPRLYLLPRTARCSLQCGSCSANSSRLAFFYNAFPTSSSKLVPVNASCIQICFPRTALSAEPLQHEAQRDSSTKTKQSLIIISFPVQHFTQHINLPASTLYKQILAHQASQPGRATQAKYELVVVE